MIIKNSPIPLHHQIYTIIKQRIERGPYQEGYQLPSENELSKEFDVTRITIRNAMRRLQNDGYIITTKGKGSVVSSNKLEQSLFRFYSFGRDFSDSSLKPATHVLSASIEPANELELSKLNLDQSANIQKIIRIRTLNDIPVIVEISTIPDLLAPGLIKMPLENLSIYNILEMEYRLPIIKSCEYLDTINCDSYFSDLLKIEAGKAVFVAERITYTTDFVPIEYRVSYIRGDKLRFHIEF